LSSGRRTIKTGFWKGDVLHILPTPLVSAHQCTVPGIRIPVQFSNIRDNAGPDRVQVNIANQFPKIGIFLADNGFVPILKKVAVTFVPAVEADRVSSKEPSHQPRKRYRTGAKKKMSMLCEAQLHIILSFT